MAWFHKHEWQRDSATYAPGTELQSVKGCTADEAMRIMSGVTTFVYKCQECGKLKKVECLGVEK